MNNTPRRHERVSIGLEFVNPFIVFKHAPRPNKHSFYISKQFCNQKNVIGLRKGMYNEYTRYSVGYTRCSN